MFGGWCSVVVCFCHRASLSRHLVFDTGWRAIGERLMRCPYLLRLLTPSARPCLPPGPVSRRLVDTVLTIDVPRCLSPLSCLLGSCVRSPVSWSPGAVPSPSLACFSVLSACFVVAVSLSPALRGRIRCPFRSRSPLIAAREAGSGSSCLLTRAVRVFFFLLASFSFIRSSFSFRCPLPTCLLVFVLFPVLSAGCLFSARRALLPSLVSRLSSLLFLFVILSLRSIRPALFDTVGGELDLLVFVVLVRLVVLSSAVVCFSCLSSVMLSGWMRACASLFAWSVLLVSSFLAFLPCLRFLPSWGSSLSRRFSSSHSLCYLCCLVFFLIRSPACLFAPLRPVIPPRLFRHGGRGDVGDSAWQCVSLCRFFCPDCSGRLMGVGDEPAGCGVVRGSRSPACFYRVRGRNRR